MEVLLINANMQKVIDCRVDDYLQPQGFAVV